MDYQNEYLKLNKDLHDSESEEKIKNIFSILPKDLKPKTILDVACGSGKILTAISKEMNPERSVGIDISEKIIEIAKKNNTNYISEWITYDIFDYKDEVFDLLLAVDIVEHVEDDDRFLKKVSELGKNIVIKVPIESNFINKMVTFLSGGKINPLRDTEKHYGHMHHYSVRDFLELIRNSNLMIMKIRYMHLPKRSKVFWEIFRILLFPIWFVSKKGYVRFNGGFMLLWLQENTYGKD